MSFAARVKSGNPDSKMKRSALAILGLLGLVLIPQAEPRPNILIIFTDDQGYADFGCFGSPTNETPRMDRLAEEGTMFTDFYAQNVCGPSRSALLTGRYPHRSGGWGMPASETTWAELLQGVGYQTACIGKWDVSDRRAILDRMPLAQGFDYYFGPLGANDHGKVKFHENNEPAGATTDMGSLTRLYTNKAIEFLKEKRDPGKPFALYLSHTMMHTDIDASEHFRGTSEGGLYGDVVEEFDYETGRLLDTLDDLGLEDDTLVIYTTDNGPWNQPAYHAWEKGHPEGSIYWGDNGPLRNGKGSCYEAGARVPCIIRWPGKVAVGARSDAIFATLDFLPTFAALTGFQVPEDRIIDGVDQTGLLLGTKPAGNRNTFFYLAQISRNANTYDVNGLRSGKWKYLKAEHTVPGYAADKDRKEVIELYDLEADIGETNNLADQHPEIVSRMQAKLKAFRNKEE
jgi:arylsulfatase A-like enzyme